MSKIAGAGALARTAARNMNQVVVSLCALWVLIAATAAMPQPLPDSAGVPPLPGPGLSYGGIPYGSMSGNVAEFFKRQSPSSGRRSNFAGYAAPAVDYAPIEQWL